MRRPVHSLDEERLLWEKEVARSARDYEKAVREGIIAPIARVRRSVAHEALQRRCRAAIARSRLLCDESRALRQASQLLHER